MGSTRQRFNEEFKKAAVDFVIDDGRTIVEVANNIGCSPAALGKWVKTAREKENRDDKPLDINEREELRNLRQEVRELKLQLEFAKKVATWFAKDPQ